MSTDLSINPYSVAMLGDRVQQTILIHRARGVLKALNPEESGSEITIIQALQLIELANEAWGGKVTGLLHERIVDGMDHEQLTRCAIGRVNGKCGA